MDEREDPQPDARAKRPAPSQLIEDADSDDECRRSKAGSGCQSQGETRISGACPAQGHAQGRDDGPVGEEIGGQPTQPEGREGTIVEGGEEPGQIGGSGCRGLTQEPDLEEEQQHSQDSLNDG